MTRRALPRIVLVTRKTPLQLLELRHGTLAQAEFYLRSRGESIREYRESHERLEAGFGEVVAALPSDQRRTRVDREQLDRFQFAKDDVVVVVGQDGLIPNTAKYLDGQLVIGINPDPDRYDGVLCRHPPARIGALLGWLREPSGDGFRAQHRTMLEAEREDGQRLLALNEVFVGHQTHQSARYRLRVAGHEERQSSSGLICATGTGCTGWALSIALQRDLAADLPLPEEDRGAWFVREPFPSVHTQVTLDHGEISRKGAVELVSEMAEGGITFADGIESDRIAFADGETLTVRLAERKLALVVEAAEPGPEGRGERAGGR
jgi:NAD kinase